MNKLLSIVLVPLLLFSCMGEHRSEAQRVRIGKVSPPIIGQDNDTLKIDLAASKIRWKATKMRGTRKHEGLVQLRQAYLLVKDGQIKAGTL